MGSAQSDGRRRDEKAVSGVEREEREQSNTARRTSCRLQLGDLVNFTKFEGKVAGRTYPLLFLIPQNEPQCDLP